MTNLDKYKSAQSKIENAQNLLAEAISELQNTNCSTKILTEYCENLSAEIDDIQCEIEEESYQNVKLELFNTLVLAQSEIKQKLSSVKEHFCFQIHEDDDTISIENVDYLLNKLNDITTK